MDSSALERAERAERQDRLAMIAMTRSSADFYALVRDLLAHISMSSRSVPLSSLNVPLSVSSSTSNIDDDEEESDNGMSRSSFSTQSGISLGHGFDALKRSLRYALEKRVEEKKNVRLSLNANYELLANDVPTGWYLMWDQNGQVYYTTLDEHVRYMTDWIATLSAEDTILYMKDDVSQNEPPPFPQIDTAVSGASNGASDELPSDSTP